MKDIEEMSVLRNESDLNPPRRHTADIYAWKSFVVDYIVHYECDRDFCEIATEWEVQCYVHIADVIIWFE